MFLSPKGFPSGTNAMIKRNIQPPNMANSKYEYVKYFEQNDVLLPNTWIVVRIDGRGFHKLVSVLLLQQILF